MLVFSLTVLWLILLNQIGDIPVLDRVYVLSENIIIRGSKFGNSLAYGSSDESLIPGESDFEVFTAVGHSKCQFTRLANQVLDQLREDNPKRVFVYSWTANTEREFKDWLTSRKSTAQVPKAHNTAPVIFNRLGNKRVFLGGVTELIEYVQARFPQIDLSKIIAQKKELEERKGRLWQPLTSTLR